MGRIDKLRKITRLAGNQSLASIRGVSLLREDLRVEAGIEVPVYPAKIFGRLNVESLQSGLSALTAMKVLFQTQWKAVRILGLIARTNWPRKF